MPVSPRDPELRQPDIAELAGIVGSLPAGCLVSHRSAAQLWGLWLPAFGGVELTTPAGDRGSRYTTSIQRRTVIAHRRIVAAADVTTLHGLPITSLARTWFDAAAACADIHDVVALGDSALRAGASTADLVETIARSRGVRGRRRIQASLPLLDAAARSRPESRIRSALVLGGLPKPEVNQAVHDQHGQWVAEPDLLYRDALLAIEYNGAHHGGLEQMRRDSVRLLDLQRAGWEVRTYTARHALSSLSEVVTDVRQLLLRRAPELLVGTQLGRHAVRALHRVTDPPPERRQERRHSA